MKQIIIKYSANLVLIFCITIKISAQSNSITETKKEENNNSFIENFKTDLDLIGLNFEIGYKGDYFSNISGGIEKKSVYMDNFDIIFSFNLDKILGLKGTSLSAYVLGNHGGEPSEFTGAIQGISNIAAYNTWKLYEFRLEQILLDGNLSLLTGLYDLNSEFDTRELSGLFINPSHGIGPEYAFTGKNGPSIFPTTSLAFRVSYNLSPLWNIKSVILDGVPGNLNNPNGTSVVFDKDDGLLFASEINFTNRSEENNFEYFKYAFGGWYYTSKFEKIADVDENGNPLLQKANYGFYGSAEKLLFTEKENSNEGLGAFIRLGWSHNEVNMVNSYIGAGLNYTGLFPGREEDILGIAVAAAHINDRYKTLLLNENIQLQSFEYNIEFTYYLKVNDWIQIQPDVQYIVNPSVNYQNDHSLVFGTRIQIGF